MNKKPINLDLSQLAEGGVQEKLDIELNRVFENIHDLNTAAKAKRKVQITLEIEPNETRDIVVMNSKIKTTLAPLMDVATTVLTGLNDEGQPEAQELKSGAKGQMVTMKTGVTTVADAQVPNPVNLAPFRTFTEVEQPNSDFIFRMKDGPTAALFESDGGHWRNKAIKNIKDYFEQELKQEIENGVISIIA